ncbi:MAG: hypothetical protein QM737_06545 [Ferruginibacter sp.]
MKNIISLLFLTVIISFFSCKQKSNASFHMLTVNLKMLDSIKQHSDSIYEKPYKRTDFVNAEYFVSKKDSTITQIMKDSSGTIRQVIIEKAKHRVYFAEFYSNGQQKFRINLDAFGQYDGAAEEYNSNGSLKRSGTYNHGLHAGKWKNFDEEGKYVSTDEYNENGQQQTANGNRQ